MKIFVVDITGGIGSRLAAKLADGTVELRLWSPSDASFMAEASRDPAIDDVARVDRRRHRGQLLAEGAGARRRKGRRNEPRSSAKPRRTDAWSRWSRGLS